jgi:ATP-dependent Clp protease, protease subunit
MMNTLYNGNDHESENAEKSPRLLKMIDMKLLESRQIFLWGPVDDDSAKEVAGKMLYLESIDPGKKITFFINSPGGTVSAGFSILDIMNLITSPVSTVCMGMAASMGSMLLSAGKKGERFIFPLGEVMIHQPSIGGMFQGTAADLAIQAKQIAKTKDIAAQILAKNCNQTVEQVLKDFDRDYWMNADESIKYGIVDGIYSF